MEYKKIHSFLLIGQSNMAGRGILSEAKPTDTDGIFVQRNGRWQEMFRPVNPDRCFSGVNLSESFAEKYVKKHGVGVGLIPCADGGTYLEQWEKGSLLYDNAVNCARLAMRTSTLAGILWHQGESDCWEGFRNTYSERLVKFVSDLRSDLGVGDIPFIAGGLGDFLEDCKWDEHVKHYRLLNQKTKEAVSQIKNAAYADASGLTANDDNLHFSAAALYEFGHRYFDQFEKLGVFVNDDDTPEADTKRTAIETL